MVTATAREEDGEFCIALGCATRTVLEIYCPVVLVRLCSGLFLVHY